MADVQIAVIDPEDTQLALAAPAEAVVNVAVPGIQGPVGTTGSVTIAQAGTAATPGIRFESDTNTGIYSPGADQLAVSTGGTGRLFVAASGNVGVGTASPSQKLHVSGGDTTNVGFNGTTKGVRFDFDGTQASIFGVDNTFFASYQPLRIGGSITQFMYGGSEAARIDSSGRVGIGTTSPGTALEVNGAAKASYSIASGGLSAFASSSGGLYTYFSSGASIIQSAADNSGTAAPLLFISGTERARIDSSGRVGIGTSSPGAKLESYHSSTNPSLSSSSGAGLSVNGTSTVRLNIGTLPGSPFSSWLQSSEGAGTAYPIALNPLGGNVGIGTSSPAGRLHVTGGESVFGSGNLTRILNASQVIDFTNAAQDTYVAGRVSGLNLKLYTNTGAGIDIDSSGRVGIGTASPIGKLDVTGSSVPLIVQSSVAASNYITHRHITSGDIAYIGNGGGGALTAGTTSDYVIRANLGSLIFACNGDNERVRIDSSGNVGIGTTSPTTLLDVNADTVRVRTARTPASATATGATGEICWDANYIYVCTATNTWRRTAISSW